MIHQSQKAMTANYPNSRMEILEFNSEIGQQFSLLALLNSLVGISS
jgi:hypothetical protein